LTHGRNTANWHGNPLAAMVTTPTANEKARSEAWKAGRAPTAPMLPDALHLMAAWGFKFKTAGAWLKQSKSGDKLAFGTGYIWRSAAEFLLVGTVGAPAWKSRSVRNAILAPVREHSRKPDEIYGMIEAMVDGPYLELFARARRPGWHAWGFEAGKFDEGVP